MMAGGWRFTPDDAGIDEISKGPATGPALDKAAEGAARNMRNLASSLRSASFYRFRSSIKTRPAEMIDGEMTAWVGSDSPGWHLQEFGTAYVRPKAILRRAMRQLGIRFEEGNR